jgi:hypothetical protein
MRAEPQRPRLTVYSRSYCHLCDEMIEALGLMQDGKRFEVHVVDVDSDPQLDERYGERVPVLVHGERELCHYRLDVPAVTAYLAQIG